MQVAAQGSGAAAVAAGADLGEQLRGVRDAVAEALIQVVEVVVEDAGPTGAGLGQELVDGGGTGETADGASREVESSGDLPDAVSLGE